LNQEIRLSNYVFKLDPKFETKLLADFTDLKAEYRNIKKSATYETDFSYEISKWIKFEFRPKLMI
jgi:hypothetical protein